MDSVDRIRAALGEAVQTASPGLSTADQLCYACVELLDVDGAAISVMNHGATQGTFGSSGELSRSLDELQFTYGEGPCLDSVRHSRPVLVPDLQDPAEQRWPAYASAVLGYGVRAVYALPVAVTRSCFGVLDLFRNDPGPLSGDNLTGGLLAAELAALPLLDLMTANVDWAAAGEGRDGWSELASLERVEVYQATGMLMGQLDVSASEAMVRLRAYAFANAMTASQVAWQIVERGLLLESDDDLRARGPQAPS
jgi:hypothetical protein